MVVQFMVGGNGAPDLLRQSRGKKIEEQELK
jgi:hypothetical protein